MWSDSAADHHRGSKWLILIAVLTFSCGLPADIFVRPRTHQRRHPNSARLRAGPHRRCGLRTLHRLATPEGCRGAYLLACVPCVHAWHILRTGQVMVPIRKGVPVHAAADRARPTARMSTAPSAVREIKDGRAGNRNYGGENDQQPHVDIMTAHCIPASTRFYVSMRRERSVGWPRSSCIPISAGHLENFRVPPAGTATLGYRRPGRFNGGPRAPLRS
uniref:Uncharacterized protein n=1 Tax=Rhodococcus sp. NS1 TaxID=402236 RepID=A0A097SPS6_9NOCA|nr:hypothetical protein LRS1606.90 [Rhodococcus sp. NS1]